MARRLDDDNQIFFYEREFYVLSNFSAFQIRWQNHIFQTAEHLYHWLKYDYRSNDHELRLKIQELRLAVQQSLSAHAAFKLAEANKQYYRPDWYDVRVSLMKEILRAKVDQHEYVKRKLLQSWPKRLIEDSPRDSWWGWGPDEQGQNILGKLWEEVRGEIRAGEKD